MFCHTVVECGCWFKCFELALATSQIAQFSVSTDGCPRLTSVLFSPYDSHTFRPAGVYVNRQDVSNPRDLSVGESDVRPQSAFFPIRSPTRCNALSLSAARQRLRHDSNGRGQRPSLTGAALAAARKAMIRLPVGSLRPEPQCHLVGAGLGSSFTHLIREASRACGAGGISIGARVRCGRDHNSIAVDVDIV